MRKEKGGVHVRSRQGVPPGCPVAAVVSSPPVRPTEPSGRTFLAFVSLFLSQPHTTQGGDPWSPTSPPPKPRTLVSWSPICLSMTDLYRQGWGRMTAIAAPNTIEASPDDGRPIARESTRATQHPPFFPRRRIQVWKYEILARVLNECAGTALHSTLEYDHHR